ncbi:MAG: hypothetical protein M3380_05990 [Chloroflexota bacterium]|nr:hypothetical protein [Chloroflexota bacterium]
MYGLIALMYLVEDLIRYVQRQTPVYWKDPAALQGVGHCSSGATPAVAPVLILTRPPQSADMSLLEVYLVWAVLLWLFGRFLRWRAARTDLAWLGYLAGVAYLVAVALVIIIVAAQRSGPVLPLLPALFASAEARS